MGKQEFNTDLQEMLMGLMSAGLKAMVQRIFRVAHVDGGGQQA